MNSVNEFSRPMGRRPEIDSGRGEVTDKSSNSATRRPPRLSGNSAAKQVPGLDRGGPPRRPPGLDEHGPSERLEIEGNSLTAVERMEQLNAQQEKMALMTATMQANAAVRSEMLQMVRDLAKDAKDAVKDVGEAGHKP